MNTKELLVALLCIAIFFGCGFSLGYGISNKDNYVTREEVHQILDSVLIDIFD